MLMLCYLKCHTKKTPRKKTKSHLLLQNTNFDWPSQNVSSKYLVFESILADPSIVASFSALFLKLQNTHKASLMMQIYFWQSWKSKGKQQILLK